MLKIVGDINLTDGYFDVGFGVGSKLQQGFDPFQHIQRNDQDCWIGNFEGVASEISKKTGNAALQFRVDSKYLNHVKHFNLYGIANNHAMQHGADAYKRTFDYLTSCGCVCFGSNAQKSQVFEHQGRKVSISGFSQRIDAFSQKPCYWHNPEYKEIEQEIKQLPKDAYKIVFVHWGNEFINRPSSPQKRFAHWLVDAGFDLVIGMHPHVLQGYEQYQGKYIFYSLGNFVFDMAWEPTHYGAIVNVDLAGAEPRISYDYVKIGEDFFPKVIDEAEVPAQYRFEELNKRISIEENSEEYHNAINNYYRQYRKANHKDILKKMLQHPSVAMGIIKDFIKRRL